MPASLLSHRLNWVSSVQVGLGSKEQENWRVWCSIIKLKWHSVLKITTLKKFRDLCQSIKGKERISWEGTSFKRASARAHWNAKGVQYWWIIIIRDPKITEAEPSSKYKYYDPIHQWTCDEFTKQTNIRYIIRKVLKISYRRRCIK